MSSFVRVTVLASSLATFASAQARPQKQFGMCHPVSERKSELGCWILTDAKVGRIDQPEVYWHVDQYASRADAERAKGSHGTVLESFGKVWLLSVEPSTWRPAVAGKHAATIGPLHVVRGKDYSATFMEAVMNPGDTSAVHRHSGPEAWFTLSGVTCLETPSGRILGTPDHAAIVPEGPPMYLTAIGKERRRSIVLVLHDAAKPTTTMAPDWKPTGACKP